MLSQKLQDDLMSAYQKVYEEKRGHAAGDSDVEKQASQLASDVRYKAKGKVKPGASDEEKKKVFIQILGASPAPQAVKSMAKQKLMGEEFVGEGLGDVVKNIMKGSAQKQQYGMTGDDMSAVRKVSKETGGSIPEIRKKRREQIGGSKIHNQRQLDKFIDKSEKDKVPVVTKQSGEYGSDTAIKRKYNPKKGVEFTDKFGKDTYPSKQYNSYEPEGEVIDEMRFNDGKEGTEKRKEALRKKRVLTKDQMDKHPQFKTEGKAYGITRGKGPGGAMKKFLDAKARKLQKEYDSQSKEKKNNPAFQSNRLNPKPVYNSHEPQGDVVNEMSGTKKSKPKNPKDMSKGVEQKAPVDYRTLAQSHVPVGNIFNEKKMDPVGQEDGDINNDGKKDGTDKYLMNRRKAISTAIKKKRGRVKEGFSAWRIDLDFNEQVKK